MHLTSKCCTRVCEIRLVLTATVVPESSIMGSQMSCGTRDSAGRWDAYLLIPSRHDCPWCAFRRSQASCASTLCMLSSQRPHCSPPLISSCLTPCALLDAAASVHDCVHSMEIRLCGHQDRLIEQGDLAMWASVRLHLFCLEQVKGYAVAVLALPNCQNP